MTAARQDIASDDTPVAYLEAALWRQLIETDDFAKFSSAWLALACGMIADARCGAVVLADNPQRAVAVWPESADAAQLLAVAGIAIAQRRGVVQKTDAAPGSTPGRCDIAYPVMVDDQALGAAVIALQGDAAKDLRAATRQLQWGIVWLREQLQRDQAASAVVKDRNSSLALDLLAAALETDGFHAACRAAATAIAHSFECERVSIGFVKRGRVHVVVISHSAQFGKHMNLVHLIGDAMDEAVDQRTSISYPASADEPHAARANASLATAQNAASVLTIPMLTHDTFVGAITFERHVKAGFTSNEISVLDGVVSALGPILEEKRRNDRWLVAKTAEAIGRQFTRLFGPGYWHRKVALVAIIAIFAAGYWWTDVYRISADALVEGQTQRAVGAPFNGFVRNAPARAGDQVAEGQILATLDDRDLVLERLRWVTERQRKVLEHERALGDRNRAEVKIIATQIEQADAQIRLVDEHIARARMTAPFAGLVVSGDLTQAIGATVQRGQILFEIAPLDSYRVMLDVDETQIADVAVSQTGRLVVSSLPNDTIPIVVGKITPVAKAHDGRNFFRVEARLSEPSPHLRPGMRGVAKLDGEERRVAWIWTRAFLHWMRLFVWRWTG